MNINAIFSKRGIIRYLIFCYFFLAFTLFITIAFGGGGHGPFVPLTWVFTVLFCLASFPASLITLFGFLKGGHPEILIPLFALSPALNVLFIALYRKLMGLMGK